MLVLCMKQFFFFSYSRSFSTACLLKLEAQCTIVMWLWLYPGDPALATNKKKGMMSGIGKSVRPHRYAHSYPRVCLGLFLKARRRYGRMERRRGRSGGLQ